ncbi:MAG: aldehyde dehydrogenase family protein [Candidatus Marinimicrobia bacterium]|nr:aldehyde dehydrogenase family protein [Candidatus Neomarinimicrobiota bacterium]
MSAIIHTEADGRVVLKCFNPATHEPLQEIMALTADGVEARLDGLREQAACYKNEPVKTRVRLIRRFRKALARHFDELCDSICQETGKKPQEAILEIFGALEIIRTAEKLARTTLKRRYRSSGVLIHKRGYVEYWPYGVATIISPWNYPLLLVVAPAVEALLAGNTVAAKPSEHTTLTALLAKQIFDAATGRPELFAVLPGTAEIGRQLVASPKTDVICFVGSTKVGKTIAVQCARLLKPVVLELGGKDAMIVLEDARLARAAKSAVWGGFSNAGQTCVSVERVYVVEPVYDEFVALLRAETGKLTAGEEPDNAIGAVTLEAQYDKINAHIDDARSKGAECEVFGEPDGWHMPPVLLTGVDHSMMVMTDETFGPELAVMKVADEEEAIAKANDSSFGLSTYLFTGNAARARRISQRLVSGAVVVNDVIVQYAMASLPIGGIRDSGLGKLHGPEGLLSFSRQRSVVEGRIDLPMELWYYDLIRKTFGMTRKFIKMWYG